MLIDGGFVGEDDTAEALEGLKKGVLVSRLAEKGAADKEWLPLGF
jgi:hypothetical protein